MTAAFIDQGKPVDNFVKNNRKTELLMKYIVYLTTNLKSKINGINRIYIGVHATNNPEIFDGYIGCGVYIQQPSTYKYPKSAFQYAVKKYGTDAFKREILFIYDNEEDAYIKEGEIVNTDFIKQAHVYNMAIGGKIEDRWQPLYQFDLNGNLVKKWEKSKDAYEFYGYDQDRFSSPKRNKCIFLNSYWSTSPTINIEEYSRKTLNNPTYLYSKEGKLLKEYSSQTDCAKDIHYDNGELSRAIKNQTLIKKQYFVSNTLTDEFVVKPRKNYINQTYYVYTINNEFVGKFVGKELMNVINLHSWDYINHIFTKNKNWYKDFYISLEKIEKIPPKRIGNGICVDVYDKYGNFIEQIKSIKEVKEKYNVPASKIKNIQLGDKYFGNYIFKYSR